MSVATLRLAPVILSVNILFCIGFRKFVLHRHCHYFVMHRMGYFVLHLLVYHFIVHRNFAMHSN